MDVKKDPESLKLSVRRGYYVMLEYRNTFQGTHLEKGYMGSSNWDVPGTIDKALLVPEDRVESVKAGIRQVISRYAENESLTFEFIPVVETVTRVTAQEEVVDAPGNDMFRDHDYALHLLTSAVYMNVKNNMFLISLLSRKPEEIKKLIEDFVNTQNKGYQSQVQTAARLGVMDLLADMKFQ